MPNKEIRIHLKGQLANLADGEPVKILKKVWLKAWGGERFAKQDWEILLRELSSLLDSTDFYAYDKGNEIWLFPKGGTSTVFSRANS